MLVHIMDQPELAEGEGPIAVIMAPTRELAEQIHREARRFSKGYGLRVCAAFGGLEKRNQVKDLKAGSEVRMRHGTYSCQPCISSHQTCHELILSKPLNSEWSQLPPHMLSGVSLTRQSSSHPWRARNDTAGGCVHAWTHD
jgi:hypothetical protein